MSTFPEGAAAVEAVSANKKEHPGQGALVCPDPILSSALSPEAQLRVLQSSRLPLSKAFNRFFALRMESIQHPDHVSWLRWSFPENPPPEITRIVEQLLAGDAYLESLLCEFRTEAGL